MRRTVIISVVIASLFCMSSCIPKDLLMYPRILLGEEDYFLIDKSRETLSSYSISKGREIMNVNKVDLGFECAPLGEQLFLGFQGRAYFFEGSKALCSLDLSSGETKKVFEVAEAKIVSSNVSVNGDILIKIGNGVFLCSLLSGQLEFLFMRKGEICGVLQEDVFAIGMGNEVKVYDAVTRQPLDTIILNGPIESFTMRGRYMLITTHEWNVHLYDIDDRSLVGIIKDVTYPVCSRLYIIDDVHFVMQYTMFIALYKVPSPMLPFGEIDEAEALVKVIDAWDNGMFFVYIYNNKVWYSTRKNGSIEIRGVDIQ